MSLAAAASNPIPFQIWLARSRAWVSLLILAPFTVAALLSKPFDVEGGWADAWFDCLSWVLFFVGATIRWWATLYIGGRKQRVLVDKGPYSVCRNPLYAGTFLMGCSVAAVLMSLTFTLGFLLVTVYYMLVTVVTEERMLLARLGQPYADYLARVPRFFPRFSNYQSAEQLEVTLSGVWAETKRMFVWGILPAAGPMIAQLRSQPWWPHPFNFL